jgi:hypothetical protein
VARERPKWAISKLFYQFGSVGKLKWGKLEEKLGNILMNEERDKGIANKAYIHTLIFLSKSYPVMPGIQ